MSIDINIESLTKELFDEADRLTKAHWEECACWKDKIELKADVDKYAKLEEMGVAKCYTLRDNSVLIGYMVILASTHLHYKDDIFASVDVLFIHPDYRKGLCSVKFMKHVEEDVKKNGAAIMTYHIKSFHDYPSLFERLGYDNIEVIYAKCLKGN